MNDSLIDGIENTNNPLGMTFALAGASSTIAGFAADFAQPIGPFALYLLIGAGIILVVIAVLYVLWRTIRPRLRSPFIFLGALTIFSAATVYLQSTAGAEAETKGAFATLIKPLAALQKNMGLLQKDIADIKETTRRTADASERTAKAVEKVAKGVEGLGALGGLIAAPKTIADYYNNALVYERRGDGLSARKMLERAIAQKSDAIDIHGKYISLLKAQEGLLGAREIYAGLARANPDNKAIAMTKAILQPGKKRERDLRALIGGDNEYGPAWFEIARLYSADRLGDQSLADKRAEKAALEEFVKADKNGGLYKHFLRKKLIDEWRKIVTARLAPYQNRSTALSPVAMSATPSNSGWMVHMTIGEPTRAIRYRVDNGEIKDTGHSNFINQATGAKQPRGFFQLPLSTVRAEIDIWYDDVRGNSQGPFRQEFDAANAHVAHAKNILENITPKWVSGREYNGKFLVYFTHLLSYKCGLQAINYGVNLDVPDQRWPLSPCDAKNPYKVGSGKLYASYGEKLTTMSVQLTYADGTKSPLKQFKFD